MEIKGIVKEIDISGGFIIGSDRNEYVFNHLDILGSIPLKKGDIVLFKANQTYDVKKTIHYATLITKEKEKNI